MIFQDVTVASPSRGLVPDLPGEVLAIRKKSAAVPTLTRTARLRVPSPCPLPLGERVR